LTPATKPAPAPASKKYATILKAYVPDAGIAYVNCVEFVSVVVLVRVSMAVATRYVGAVAEMDTPLTK
jgi:hypothetical protein